MELARPTYLFLLLLSNGKASKALVKLVAVREAFPYKVPSRSLCRGSRTLLSSLDLARERAVSSFLSHTEFRRVGRELSPCAEPVRPSVAR